MNKKHWIVLFVFGLFILACKKDNPVKEQIDGWLGFVKPSNFPEPEYKLANNPVTKEGFDEPVDLGQALLAQIADRLPEPEDPFIGQAIVRVGAFAADIDELGTPQCLEVLGGVGEGEAGLSREFFHRALALGQEVEQLEPVRVGDGLAYPGELVVEQILEFTMVVHTFN